MAPGMSLRRWSSPRRRSRTAACPRACASPPTPAPQASRQSATRNRWSGQGRWHKPKKDLTPRFPIFYVYLQLVLQMKDMIRMAFNPNRSSTSMSSGLCKKIRGVKSFFTLCHYLCYKYLDTLVLVINQDKQYQGIAGTSLDFGLW